MGVELATNEVGLKKREQEGGGVGETLRLWDILSIKKSFQRILTFLLIV